MAVKDLVKNWKVLCVSVCAAAMPTTGFAQDMVKADQLANKTEQSAQKIDKVNFSDGTTVTFTYENGGLKSVGFKYQDENGKTCRQVAGANDFNNFKGGVQGFKDSVTASKIREIKGYSIKVDMQTLKDAMKEASANMNAKLFMNTLQSQKS